MSPKWNGYKFKNLMELQLGQTQRTTVGPIIKKGGGGGQWDIIFKVLKMKKKKQTVKQEYLIQQSGSSKVKNKDFPK